MANYTENGVNFNVGDAGIYTGGMKISRLPYETNNGKIQQPQKVVNAIDIDWNEAQVNGIDSPISSTAQLLKILGELYSGSGGGVSERYKHVILEREEYDALESYDDNTLYFVIGEDTSGDDDEPTQLNYLIIKNLDTGEITNKISGNLILTPGYKYELSGVLNNGYINVDCSEKTSEQMKNISNTILYLNNVTINSPENYGIIYSVPTHVDADSGEIVKDNKGFKDLVVSLYRNTINTINCTKEPDEGLEERPQNQEGAIYSMNNLTVQGAGYLIISNKFGHGLRGSELRYCGPYTYFDVYHDAIHGKHIAIEDGIVYVKAGNDVIGTGDSGRIMVYGGNFYSSLSLTGQLFDSALPGLVLSDNITIEGITSTSNMMEFNQANFITVVKSINNVQDIINGVYTAIIDTDGNVRPGAQIELNETSQTYNITNTNNIYVTGVINNPIVLRQEDSTVYLNNAFITNTHAEGAIYYNTNQENVKGKLKIMCESDTINYVHNTYVDNAHEIINSTEAQSAEQITIGNFGFDAIKSENNIEIEIKNGAHLYVTANCGDGIDGGNVLINDSKGCIIINNCGLRGIKGNTVVLGVNASITGSNSIIYYDDPEELSEADQGKVKYFSGAIIVKNNCKKSGISEHNKQLANTNAAKNYGFGDIYGRNGKANLTKGIIATKQKVVDGVIITGSIGAVKMITLDNSNNFYYYYNITRDDAENMIGVPEQLNSVTTVYDTNKKSIQVI